jgi:hypothetical protein
MRADEFLNEACWTGYKQVGMKKKGTKTVPNCVPVEENASGDSSLHDWFSKSKASDGTKGWVQIGGKYAGKPCAKQPGQTTKPKCGSSKMKRNLNAKEEEAAARRKRKEDPNPDRRGKARNVATKNESLKEDSTLSPSAVRKLQGFLNKNFRANLDVDGVLGELTKKSIEKYMPSVSKQLAPNPNRTTRIQGFDNKESQDKDVAEGWSKKYKDSINCSNPKGFSQKAHCASKKKK